MAKQNVSLSNTFNEWRLKTNTIGAWLGDADTITPSYSASYVNVQGSSPTGNGAQFDIDITAGVYSVANIDLGGSGYNTNDDITIPGSSLGGVDGVHDLVLNVDSQSGNSVTAVSVVSGTPSPDLVAEFNISVQDILDLQTFTGEGTVLDTTSTDLADAVNELHGEINTNTTNIGTIGSLTTTATDLVGAVNELDLKQGSSALTTSASDLSGAVNELDAQIGPITGGAKGDILYEIYGTSVQNMTDNYDGTETNIIDALNYLYDVSDAATLDGAYLKTNGSNEMEAAAYLTVSNVGITSKDTENLILATKNSSNVDTARMTIADSTGNIGINKAPGTYKVDVSGSVNATTLYEGGTTLSGLYQTLTGSNTITADQTHTGSNTFNPGAGESLVIGSTTVASDTLTISEWAQDVVGAMVSGNSETGGISVTYQDSDGTLDFAIADNGHNHTSSNISDFAEAVQDIAGGMVAGNTESGITVTYDDGTGKLNFTVNSFNTFSVTDTDSGFTWSSTGDIIVDSANDTIKWVSGSGVDIDADAGSDAIRVSHADTSTQASVNNVNGTVIQDITLDTYGHLTGLESVDLDLRYSKNTFQTIARNGTDSGFTWGTANVVSDSLTDTLTFVDGSGIDIATDSTNDAIRFTVDSDWVKDEVGGMVSANSESGISVSYDSGNKKLDFDVNDFTIQLTGDVTSNAITVTNLGSIEIPTSIGALTVDIGDISGFDEGVQDAINTAIVTNGSHSGISFTYDDAGNGIDATVSVNSTHFQNLQTVLIQSSAGATLKTIYTPGS